MASGRHALGRAVRRAAVRPARRRALRVPAASRARPPAIADASQLPRQHRRAEALRRAPTCCRSPRSAASRRNCRPAISSSSISSSTAASPGRKASSARAGRPCVDGAPGVRAARRRAGGGRRAVGLPVTRGGTYLVMEGPQFSTKAESELYRSWGCSVIGMTNMPEAKLAREAELCYATVAMVTDFDCWHPDHDPVTVEAGGERAVRQRRQGAGTGAARRPRARQAARACVPPAATGRSTMPSSPRATCATLRWLRSSTLSRGGCCSIGAKG